MRELVLSFCSEDFGHRAVTVRAELEDGAHAAVNPLFEARPSTGARLVEVALPGRPRSRAWAHGPRISDGPLDRIEVDELGFLTAYQEADGARHAAPIGAGREWLRERLREGEGGLVEVRVTSVTPFGAVWETCLEAQHAGRGGVRLAVPVPGMYSRAIHFPGPGGSECCTVRSGIEAVLEPFLMFFLLVFVGPIVLAAYLLSFLFEPIRYAFRPRIRRRARSALEAHLFAAVGRCPGCGYVSLLRPEEEAEHRNCMVCEAEIRLERPPSEDQGLTRVNPSAAPSELIDLWGWIELAEQRRGQSDRQAQWELVQCLHEALKFLTPEGEPIEGAFFTPITRGLAAEAPERCSRDRIVSWLFELPTQDELLAA